MATQVRPSFDEFMSAARDANPDVSDADLSAYYRTEYGAPDTNYSLPSLPTFLKSAQAENPDVPEHELRNYWQTEYGSKGARETEPTGSDISRGFQNTFKQIPQLLHGAEAGLGAAGESLFGEGGVSTSIKEHGLKGFQEDSASIESTSKNSDQFLNAWESAKSGDLGGLADFLQYGLGYAGGQAVQMLATGGLGFVAGKLALQPIATTLAQRLVAKEVARIGETEAGKAMAASELQQLAVANVAGKIGQTVALAGTAVGMEGGEIGGDLAQSLTEEGRVASGEELAKAFGSTLAAGGLEFVGDKIGLDLILGKSRIGKAVSGTGIANRLKGAAVSGTAGIVTEGATEFAQTLLEEFGKGNDPFADESIREAINAAALGSVAGGTVGAGSGMIHRPAVVDKPAEAPKPAVSTESGVLDPKVYADLETEDLAAQEKAQAQYTQQAQAVTIRDIVSAPTIEDAIAKAAELMDSETAVLSKPPAKRASIADVPVLPGVQTPTADALVIPGQAFTPREADPMATIRAERERLVYENRPKLPRAAEPVQELQTVEPVKPLPTALSKAYPSVQDIHRLAESKGLEWDNNQVFKEMTKLVTGKSHLDDLTPLELQKMFNRLSKIQGARQIEPATPPPTPTLTTAEGEPALPFEQEEKQTEPLSTFEAAQVPRGTLTDEQNAEMLARAEKAQADLEIAGNERGGRYFNETQGRGGDQDVTGLKSATAQWFKEATSGPGKLSRQRVESAVNKILADKGRDTGRDVQRIKELLLQDQEFNASPFAPRTDDEWKALIAEATHQPVQSAPLATGKGREGSRYEDDNLEDLLAGTEEGQRDRLAAIKQAKDALAASNLKPGSKAREKLEKEILSMQQDYDGAYREVSDAAGEDVSNELRKRVELNQEAAPNGETDEQAHVAATSPQNDLPEPTEGQKKAGNYQKGHIRMAGMELSIENPAGSERSGTDANGKPWSITMKDHYGYIRGTKGKDKDHIDIFVKPGTPVDYNGKMFVIDQRKPGTKAFDEHKVIMGAADSREATTLYEQNYAKSWKGLGSLSTFTMEQFKAWLRDGDHTQPAVNYKAPQAVATETTATVTQRTEREKLDALRNVSNKDGESLQSEPFLLTNPTETKPKAKGPEQLSIDVPAPTIGERPIIGREVQPEEAPLFSESAKTPEPEQTELSPSAKTIAALNGELHGMASQKQRITSTQIDEARELIGRAERLTEVDGDHLTGLQRRSLRANIRQMEERIRDENSGTSMPTWLEEQAIAYTAESAVAELDEKGQGAKIVLANGWTIRTVRISGNERYELRGENLRESRGELEKAGLFMERIQFDPRWFIPSDQVTEIVEALTKYRPIIEVLGKAEESGLSNAQKMKPLGLPAANQQSRSVPEAINGQKDVFSDPPAEEARTVQAAIEGRTALEAAQFLADSAPSEAQRLIASRVAIQIQRLQDAGMGFEFHIAHLNDRVPLRLIGTKGLTWLPERSSTTQVWIQGADVEGFVGTSYETVLHELLHSVTQAALYLGNHPKVTSAALRQPVQDLYKVGNAIIAHMKGRHAASERGETTLTPFEQKIIDEHTNALEHVGEILSWGFTNAEMQRYLEGIPYQASTLWSRFVEAVRTFLDLPAKRDTALSEVLRIGDVLLDAPVNELMTSFRDVWMPTQINQYRDLINNRDRTLEDEGLTFDGPTEAFTPAVIEGRQEPLRIGEGSLAYELPAMSNMDAVIRTLQDKNIDLVRLVDAIKATGKTISDGLNPVLKEEMYMGRTSQRLQDFLNDELRPLVDHMRLHGVTMEQLDEYLHARHAQEANLHLKEINPDLEDNEALSGMSNEKAQSIIANAEPKMEKLAARVDAILGKTRDLMVDYGIESPERVSAWKEQYAYYVPLHRAGFEDGTPGTGQGRSIRGSSVKSRTGSTRRVIDILANVALDREKTLVRGEKNRVSTALGALLQKHPNPDIATLSKPAPVTYTNEETGLLETAPGNLGEYRVPMVKGISKKTGEVEWRPDPTYKGRDNVINFRIAGKDHSIIFNENNPRALAMAHALKDLDVGQLNGLLSAIAPVTRYISAVNTAYSPIFGVVNFIRDIQFAMLSLSSTPLAGKRADIARYTMQSLKGIFTDARAVRRGEEGDASPTAQLWKRFQEVGGPTGYRDHYRNSGDRAKAIEHLLDPEWWQKTMAGKFLTVNGLLAKPEQLILDKGLKPMFDLLQDYNTTMENAVRLGTFKAGIESGLSDERAASIAKNLTVNFGKRGQITAQAGALYAFFNASVQGTTRVAETLFEPGKVGVLSAMGKKIIAGGVTLGALQTFALAMAGFGDDDPPEWLKARNLIIPAPGTDRGFVSIPLPLGFNVLPSIGRLTTEALWYGKPIERIYSMMGVMLDAFSPVGGSAGLTQFIAPSFADPLVALGENRDWSGREIFKENDRKLNPTTGMSRARSTSTPWARGLATAINYLSGGTDYSPGKFSPSPDAIDYLLSQAAGGIGREVSKTAQTAGSLAAGEDTPLHRVPLLGRLVGSSSGASAVRDEFYRNVQEINTMEEEFSGRKENREDAAGFAKDNPTVRLSRLANSIEREVSKLSKQKREMVRRGAHREQIKLMEMRISSQMQRLNQAVVQTEATAAR